MLGKVKWFDEAKGFGFIVSGDKDYFVHYKNIAIPGFKTLKENDEVNFSAESSPKGLIAKEVTRVNPNYRDD